MLNLLHIYRCNFNRSPEQKFKNVRYLGLDGERNLYVTFLAACEFIQTSIEKVKAS
jgi:hypothetical protein